MKFSKSALFELTRKYLALTIEDFQDVSAISELQEIIRDHNELYYVESDPIIDDGQYDILFRLLRELEEQYGVFDPTSPTRRIDVLVSRQFQKGTHLVPMISLDNTYNAEEVRDFGTRARNYLDSDSEPLASVLELKFDGLGMSVLYRDGAFVRALTRGNWLEWEDVSINALEIAGVPKILPFRGEIEIRGEVIMPHSAFERVNSDRLQSWEKLFANPRNAASWSLRQLDPLITRSRGLEFFAYSVPYLEQENNVLSVQSYPECIELLTSWGFHISPFFERYTSMELLADRVKILESNRPKFPFDIDGLVIKMESYELWRRLGATEHHPRSAIAYKFPQELVQTILRSIEHSVGRTWIVTPVAHLEPVGVGGVIVSRATLHNYEELERKWVRIGDVVFIRRAWEVIPEVVSPVESLRTGNEQIVEIPQYCPSCGTELTKDEGKVAIFCPNITGCPAQTSWALKGFVSKHAANIDGFGEKMVELFIQEGLLTDFVSIYQLKNFRNRILALEGFEQKKTDNVLEALEKSRTMELPRLLVALGIPEVGRKTAKIIALHVAKKYKKALDDLQEETLHSILLSLTEEELKELRDVWPVGAESVVGYIQEQSEMLWHLLQEVHPALPKIPSALVVHEGGEVLENPETIWEVKWSPCIAHTTSSSWFETLFQKSFCVTGGFEGVSRDQIHAYIEDGGGEVRTSVSSKLQYLIVGSDAGSKLQKAKELGVGILTIDDFVERFGRGW
jgi:DNA ligase (NAD+)